MRRGTSLLGMVFPFFLPMIILAVSLLGFSFAGRVQPAVYDHIQTILQENAFFLRNLSAHILAREESSSQLPTFPQKDAAKLTRLALYDAQGRLISSSGPAIQSVGNEEEMEMIARVLRGEEVSRIPLPGDDRARHMYIALPVYAPEGKRIIGAVQISTSLTPINRGFEVLYRLIFYLALAMLIVAYGCAYLLSRSLAVPLRNLTRAAEHYGELNFRYRPYIETPAELREAAEALTNSIEKADTRMQLLVHDKEELQTVFEGMVEGVIVLDSNLTIKEINPAFANLLRIDVNTARGKSLINVVRHSQLYDIAKAAAEEERLIERTVQLPISHEKPGSSPRLPASARIHGYMHLRIHAICITTDILEHGIRRQQKRVIMVMNDITRLKNLERMRKDFVSNVSHELKTPITTIKGFTETLREGAADDPETSARFVNIIHHHTERLEAIIEDLLSLSRLEREDETAISREPTSAAQVVERTVQSRSRQAEKKGITLTSECPAELELTANASLLEQALLNLVDNAVKYCSSGARVAVTCGGSDETVYFQVEDNGPGIPAKELDRIFERFYRVDKTRSRELGGTGLGLAIVKHIAIAHEGTIEVESTEGLGTIFTLSIPLQP